MLILQFAAKPHGVACPPANDEIRVTTPEEIEEMSKFTPPRPSRSVRKCGFAIVASQFNAPYVQGLVDHAEKELRGLAPNATTVIHRVPGSFEIPVAVREIALREKADAIIACGVIIQGQTNHAKNLSRSVTDALQRVAVDYGVPVINVVLSFDN